MSVFRIKRNEDESLNKTIRMKSSLIEKISVLAGEHDISFNTLVVQMCEFALLHLPSKGENTQAYSENSGQ